MPEFATPARSREATRVAIRVAALSEATRVAVRRRTAALLALYTAWLRGTWRAKRLLRSWGPRWLARWLSLPLPWLAALLGISAETRLDGVTEDVLATIGYDDAKVEGLKAQGIL